MICGVKTQLVILATTSVLVYINTLGAWFTFDDNFAVVGFLPLHPRCILSSCIQAVAGPARLELFNHTQRILQCILLLNGRPQQSKGWQVAGFMGLKSSLLKGTD
jgi:hypothetical protein